ncbi:MAG: calcium-translocating P-type ATPase, PMCA-type [Candidatus Dojkabacteria bacterium]
MNLIKIKEILKILLRQLASPLVYILLFASIVTLFLKEFTDFIVLLISITINTLLGFYQEYKAHDTVEKLKNYIKSRNLVESNGKLLEIDSTDIKVGDIVVITEEYKIPADGNLIEGDITVNEHILTGESLPITKSVGDQLYQGTSVTNGYAKYQVKRIGQDTKFGEISRYVLETEEPLTPLQRQLSRLAHIISFLVLFSSVGLFVFGLLRNYKVYEVLTVAVAVAVAAVPEGLVIALTVILAVGMRSILKKNAVVKKLVSAETLGSVTTICIDKTGTITQGKLTVEYSNLSEKSSVSQIIKYGNNGLDVLDKAILLWAKKNGVLKEQTSELWRRVEYLPFNSLNKFTSALIRTDSDQYKLLIYGAAEILLKNSKLNKAEQTAWEDKINELTGKGAKVIGYAIKEVDADFVKSKQLNDISNSQFVGIHGLSDPIRANIHTTLSQISDAGIKLKLITGDHLVTALNIAKQAGLVDALVGTNSDLVITGDKLDPLSDTQLQKVVKDVVIFARVSPKHKFLIVEALSKIGEVVAMTGDGVNDAPALKRASIGIVVNEASDVSKEVADIVLLDSNLQTIVHSIEEGRRIFANIKKVTLYLLSDSLTELILIITSLILKLPLAITAAQILWINLIEDSLPALSLSMEPSERDLMKVAPDKKKFKIIDRDMLVIMIAFILFTDLSLVFLYYSLSKAGLDIELIRTIIFATLGFDSILYIFACKSISKPIFRYNIFSNKYLLFSVLFGLSMIVVAIYIPFFNNLLDTVPLAWEHWYLVLVFGFFTLLIIETVKLFLIKVKEIKSIQKG